MAKAPTGNNSRQQGNQNNPPSPAGNTDDFSKTVFANLGIEEGELEFDDGSPPSERDVSRHTPDEDDDNLGLPREDDSDEADERAVEALGKSKADDDAEARPKAPTQGEPRADEGITPRPGRYDKDKKGNILDHKTGKVIAKAGAEARLFEARVRAELQSHRVGMENQKLTDGLRKAIDYARQFKTQLDTFREASEAGGKLGLTPYEMTEAATIAAQLKNPATALEGIKVILTRAAAAGIDLSSLGVAGGAFNAKELLAMVRGEIEKSTAPLRERTEQEAQTAQSEQQQRENFDRIAQHTLSFFENTPDALPHAKVIAAALRDPRFKGWTLREVWMALQLHLRDVPQRGEDTGPGAQSRPMPGNRRVVNAPNGRFDATKPAPVTDSYEKIVGDLMHAAGIRS